MENIEQTNSTHPRESTVGKEESKEDQKLNMNGAQPESKKEKSQKEGEMSYDEYINSLEEDEKNKVKEIFELFDKNLDGGVDMKELKFILNSLDIYPNHDELSAMMAEADVNNKGYINEKLKLIAVFSIKSDTSSIYPSYLVTVIESSPSIKEPTSVLFVL